MPSPSGLILVTCSFPSGKEAENALACLLEKRLVACGHISCGRSAYVWEGKINQEDERMLRMKTLERCWPELEKALLDSHSYDVPMIIAEPILYVNEGYRKWVEESVT